jgi:hypothetical protein
MDGKAYISSFIYLIYKCVHHLIDEVQAIRIWITIFQGCQYIVRQILNHIIFLNSYPHIAHKCVLDKDEDSEKKM